MLYSGISAIPRDTIFAKVAFAVSTRMTGFSIAAINMLVASAMRITKIEKRYSIIGELQDVLWALLTSQSIVAKSTFALGATFTR